MHVLQRLTWNGTPVHEGDLWRLTKGRHRAVCRLYTHQFGWELRVDLAGDLRRSQVCRSQDEVLDTAEEWQAAMHEKGWS